MEDGQKYLTGSFIVLLVAVAAFAYTAVNPNIVTKTETQLEVREINVSVPIITEKIVYVNTTCSENCPVCEPTLVVEKQCSNEQVETIINSSGTLITEVINPMGSCTMQCPDNVTRCAYKVTSGNWTETGFISRNSVKGFDTGLSAIDCKLWGL
jgi:fumarate hydratase class II